MTKLKSNYKGLGKDVLCTSACKAEEERTEQVFNCTAYRRALGSKVQVDIMRESRLSKLKEASVFANELEQYKDKMGILLA